MTDAGRSVDVEIDCPSCGEPYRSGAHNGRPKGYWDKPSPHVPKLGDGLPVSDNRYVSPVLDKLADARIAVFRSPPPHSPGMVLVSRTDYQGSEAVVLTADDLRRLAADLIAIAETI